MSLKFKRNLPILVSLIGILLLLAVFMGNQQVSAYSIIVTNYPDLTSDPQILATNDIATTIETEISPYEIILSQ